MSERNLHWCVWASPSCVSPVKSMPNSFARAGRMLAQFMSGSSRRYATMHSTRCSKALPTNASLSGKWPLSAAAAASLRTLLIQVGRSDTPRKSVLLSSALIMSGKWCLVVRCVKSVLSVCLAPLVRAHHSRVVQLVKGADGQSPHVFPKPRSCGESGAECDCGAEHD